MSLLGDVVSAWEFKGVAKSVLDALIPLMDVRAGGLVRDIEGGLISEMYQSLLEAARNGMTSQEWAEKIAPGIMNAYISPDEEPGWYIEQSVRTNVQQSMAAGNYERMFDPEHLAAYPFWQYVTMEDDRVRPDHQLLSHLIFRKDDEIGRHYLPPCGYNCRCWAVDVTAEDAAKYGHVTGFYVRGELGVELPERFDVDRTKMLYLDLPAESHSSEEYAHIPDQGAARRLSGLLTGVRWPGARKGSAVTRLRLAHKWGSPNSKDYKGHLAGFPLIPVTEISDALGKTLKRDVGKDAPPWDAMKHPREQDGRFAHKAMTEADKKAKALRRSLAPRTSLPENEKHLERNLRSWQQDAALQYTRASGEINAYLRGVWQQRLSAEKDAGTTGYVERLHLTTANLLAYIQTYKAGSWSLERIQQIRARLVASYTKTFMAAGEEDWRADQRARDVADDKIKGILSKLNSKGVGVKASPSLWRGTRISPAELKGLSVGAYVTNNAIFSASSKYTVAQDFAMGLGSATHGDLHRQFMANYPVIFHFPRQKSAVPVWNLSAHYSEWEHIYAPGTTWQVRALRVEPSRWEPHWKGEGFGKVRERRAWGSKYGRDPHTHDTVHVFLKEVKIKHMKQKLVHLAGDEPQVEILPADPWRQGESLIVSYSEQSASEAAERASARAEAILNRQEGAA